MLPARNILKRPARSLSYLLCDCTYCSLRKEEASLDCVAGSFFFFKLRDTAVQKLN